MKFQTTSMPESLIEQAQATYMSKVYAWMFAGLLITGFTAWYFFNSGLIFSIAGWLLPLIIVQLALVFILSARVHKLSYITASIMFLGYSLLTGITLSTIFVIYELGTIQEVFFIAASMFAALSAFGYFTKKSLSGIGNFLFMGLFGIIIASIVNIFIGSSGLYFAISFVGVLIFAGLTAYDTQKIKEMYILQYEDEAMASKGAIIGALALYLDFINMFLFLLRIFSSRD